MTLSHLWQIFKNAWWKIVAITLIAVIAAGTATHFLVQRKYASTTTFIIVNVNQNIDYTLSTTLSADQQLAENYIEVIKSDIMMDLMTKQLEEKEGIKIHPSTLRSMISASTSNSASTFAVTVTSSESALSYKIATYIAEIAPALVTEVTKPGELSATISWATIVETLNKKAEKTPEYHDMAIAVEKAAQKLQGEGSLTVQGTQNRLECIRVLRQPTQNRNPVSPNIAKVAIIAGIIALILAYAFFLVCDLMSTTVKTEEDVKRLTDLPILGTIPKWDKKSLNALVTKGEDSK